MATASTVGGWVTLPTLTWNTNATTFTYPTIRNYTGQEHDAEGSLPGRSREMTIQTADDLATVPVGSRVFVNDAPYWRIEPGWFSATEGGPRLLRDEMLTGYAGTGQVLTEDEASLKPGSWAKGAHSFMILDAVEGANVRVTRFYHSRSNSVRTGSRTAYQYRDDNHYELKSWFRANRYEPTTDDWAGVYASLRAKYQEVFDDRARIDAERTNVTRERDMERRATDDFRAQMRQFLGV